MGASKTGMAVFARQLAKKVDAGHGSISKAKKVKQSSPCLAAAKERQEKGGKEGDHRTRRPRRRQAGARGERSNEVREPGRISLDQVDVERPFARMRLRA